MKNLEWWKKTTVYQIYPRSYKDTTGNGIGDLAGIISKLDYIQDLGFETIWFSPFYTSPQADIGYDIADYKGIAPEYGTMEQCDQLIEELHKRDMHIVLDMVLNHTSDQHPWFLESRSSRDNPKRDWYVWQDGKKPNGKAPPNNWRALPGGSGWEYDEKTDQWFYHAFLPFQPDLNYRNPELKETMFDIMRYWLEKGVDGFRLDIINMIYEDSQFKDNPFSFRAVPSDEAEGYLFQEFKYTANHPDTLAFAKELRSVIDEFGDPDRFLVGEVTGPMPTLQQYCGLNGDGLNLVFLFKSLGASLKKKTFKKLIQEYEKYFKPPLIPTWVFANHDRFRRISRLGDNREKAKLNAALQFTVRGVPFTYYGEEIGMPQHEIPMKESKDAVALKYKKIPQFIFKLVRKIAKESLNRDECRTPMQWDASPNAGFCSAEADPWLPVTPNYEEINVKAEKANPDTLYHCYKRFLEARKTHPSLNAGDLTLLTKNIPKGVLAYQRVGSLTANEKEITSVYLNFTGKAIEVQLNAELPKLVVSTTINRQESLAKEIVLDPYEGIVIL